MSEKSSPFSSSQSWILFTLPPIPVQIQQKWYFSLKKDYFVDISYNECEVRLSEAFWMSSLVEGGDIMKKQNGRTDYGEKLVNFVLPQV